MSDPESPKSCGGCRHYGGVSFFKRELGGPVGFCQWSLPAPNIALPFFVPKGAKLEPAAEYVQPTDGSYCPTFEPREETANA